MNLAQRIVVAIYCLLLAYCCVWIPWRTTTASRERRVVEVVYSIVWAAPTCDCKFDNGVSPEMHLILLRVVAITAITGALLAITGWYKSA
jgi:hypothetical protein